MMDIVNQMLHNGITHCLGLGTRFFHEIIIILLSLYFLKLLFVNGTDCMLYCQEYLSGIIK